MQITWNIDSSLTGHACPTYRDKVTGQCPGNNFKHLRIGRDISLGTTGQRDSPYGGESRPCPVPVPNKKAKRGEPMIIADDQLMQLMDAIVSPPFSLHPNSMSKVYQVLKDGNEKHGDDDQGAEVHLEAALRHLNQTGTDEETGEPHRAHCAARCILTLLALSQGDSQ